MLAMVVVTLMTMMMMDKALTMMLLMDYGRTAMDGGCWMLDDG